MSHFFSIKGKRAVSIFICITLFSLFSNSITIYGASNTQAVTIRMKSIVGKGTSVSNMAGKKVSARKNMKLYSGYKVATGRKNYVYMSLDSSKAIKEDQNSKIQVKKQGGKNNIYVISGKLFFNVSKKLSSNESMNVKTSNISMGIRGTSGVVSVKPILDKAQSIQELQYNIQIFDGTGYVEYNKNDGTGIHNTTLPAGYQLTIKQDIEGEAEVKKEKIEAEAIPAFALEEMLNNDALQNRVLNETDLTKQELEDALEKNEKKEEEETENLEKVSETIKDAIAKNETIIYGDKESNSSSSSQTGDTSTSSPTPTPTPTPLNEYNFNIDNLPEGKLKQTDLDQAFTKSTIVRLVTESSQKTVELSGQVTIKTGKTLIADEAITLNNPAGNTLENNGKLTNYGTHSIHNKGIIKNTGEICNEGNLYIEQNSSLTNTGIIRNIGELKNTGQLSLEGGSLINSGIVANMRGSVLIADPTKVTYENTGSLRIFSGTELGGNVDDVGDMWVPWRIVRFADTDGTTILKESYVPMGGIPEAPKEVEERENFTGWDARFDTGEDIQVAATEGKLLMLEYMEMKIGCDSFADIDMLSDTVGNNAVVNVTLMKDYNIAEDYPMEGDAAVEVITFSDTKSVELNGHTISALNNQVIRNNGNLTIKNSKGTGGIEITIPDTSLFLTSSERTAVQGLPALKAGDPMVELSDRTLYNAGDSLTLENIKISVTSSKNIGTYGYGIIDNSSQLTLNNCELKMDGIGALIGIKNNEGQMELINTIIEINTSDAIGIELSSLSPVEALKETNSCLKGSGNNIIGIHVWGSIDKIAGGEDAMEFQLNETCQKIMIE